MKHLSFFLGGTLLMVLLTISSCSDPCKDVPCFNGGECVDGTCICPDEYYGADCGQQGVACGAGYCINGGTCVNNQCDCPPCYRGTFCESPDLAHYIGIYTNQELCDGGNYTYQISIDSTQLQGFDLVVYNLAGAGDFAGMNLEGCNFQIPLQNYSTGNISGSGSISNNGTSINMSYTFSNSGITENCVATLTR